MAALRATFSAFGTSKQITQLLRGNSRIIGTFKYQVTRILFNFTLHPHNFKSTAFIVVLIVGERSPRLVFVLFILIIPYHSFRYRLKMELMILCVPPAQEMVQPILGIQ